MPRDAHIHLANLLELDPGFPERLEAGLAASPGGPRWSCCAASHDEAEWRATEGLRARLPPFVSSFGIHPQWAVWDHAALLESLAAAGALAAIGEAGFDFFGDRPERVRDRTNEGAQRAVFEFQLALAERLGLPLLLHMRKAMDLAFAYAPRLRRLPAAIFHSFPGTAEDAESLLSKGVEAFFSFGAPILNGNKRAAAACARLPEDRLLSETDAPWQPPRRRSSEAAAPEGRGHCRAEDLELVTAGMATLRGMARETLEAALEDNFRRAYSLP